jgi:hypothetical protein
MSLHCRILKTTTFFRYTVDRMSSQVYIFFKNQDFFPMVIQQQLSTLDFIGYCGGSLGLFLGFSALSAVEIVYYFTLRIVLERVRRIKVDVLSGNSIENESKNYLVELLENSSIHGCNQIVMKKRLIFERFG